MSLIYWAGLTGTISALATGLGAIPVHFLRQDSKIMRAFASAIAAGMMISASVFSLAQEGIALRDKMPLAPYIVIFGLLLGEVFFGESHESGSREEHALSDYDEDFWSDRMRALVIDDAAKARVKEVLDFAMKKENWWTLGEGTPPGDREGFVTELDTFRVVFSITVVEGKPHRHISISVPRNLPHPIAAFTIAGMFGFTGGKQENDVCVGPGPDWQVGPHEKERAVMMLQPLEQK